MSFEKRYKENAKKLAQILSDIHLVIEDYADYSPQDWEELSSKILYEWGNEEGSRLVSALYMVRKHLDHLKVFK